METIVQRLKELEVGAVFTSVEETGDFVYKKTDKVDRFGAILCVPVNYNPFPDPHWHNGNEKVERDNR